MLAVIILGEKIESLAIIGMVAIVLGIYTVSWWGNFRELIGQPLAILKNPGTRYAILTGLTITIYALVDKKGVAQVQPFLYMYLMTLGSAIGLAPYVLGKQGQGHHEEKQKPENKGRSLLFHSLPDHYRYDV